ncbi:MAG: hypothetical protein JWM88_75 [Verrucomicrobia bacterium]|nr:hypothetical protein [Verrucomicrobiota bacterium]
MIFDQLANAALYANLGPRFALGLKFIREFNPAAPDGRVSLDGDDVYALVQSYVPTPAAGRPFESHRVYVDLQYVAVGEEIIQYSPLPALTVTTPYSAANDAALYSGADSFPLYFSPGSFAFLFPTDGHKPCCLWRSNERVKKVVVKIRL